VIRAAAAAAAAVLAAPRPRAPDESLTDADLSTLLEDFAADNNYAASAAATNTIIEQIMLDVGNWGDGGGEADGDESDGDESDDDESDRPCPCEAGL
jgi:hypothetical protein